MTNPSQPPSSSEKASGWREFLLLAGVGLTVTALAWPAYRQGLNLLDDGVWLLGAESVASGNVLYRDFFTIYGPARFVLLAAMFLVWGTSAATLALLESIVLGATAALGMGAARLAGAGRLSWLIPLAMLATGPLKLKVLAVALVAVAWGWSLRGSLSPARALGLGIFAGLAGTFGFDALLQIVLVLGITAWLNRARHGWRTFLQVGIGFLLSTSIPWIWAAVTGALGNYAWDAWVYPALHFRREMGISLLTTLTDTQQLGVAFPDLSTGEILPTFLPGHSVWRIASAWSWALWIVATPLLLAGRHRFHRDDPLRCSLLALAVASLLPLGGRAALSHLLAAAPAAIWIAPLWLATLPRRSVKVASVSAIVLVSLGPSLAEHFWLTTHSDRSGLERWARPRGDILLLGSRIENLEQMMRELPGDAADPAIFWPALPGLHFVFDIPCASPQVTTLGGEVQDPQALVRELQRSLPARVVLSDRWRIGNRNTRDLCPEAWDFFRGNYRVVTGITDSIDRYFILEPVPGGRSALLELPMTERLYDRRQSVANDRTPDLSTGLRVGQSLNVGGLDLSGLRLGWQTAQPGTRVPVQIVLWHYDERGLGEPFQGYNSELVIEGREKVSEFAFSPPARTAGRRIAFTIEVTEPGGPPVHLIWHRDDEDFFAEGSAIVDGKPQAADLYFATY